MSIRAAVVDGNSRAWRRAFLTLRVVAVLVKSGSVGRGHAVRSPIQWFHGRGMRLHCARCARPGSVRGGHRGTLGASQGALRKFGVVAVLRSAGDRPVRLARRGRSGRERPDLRVRPAVQHIGGPCACVGVLLWTAVRPPPRGIRETGRDASPSGRALIAPARRAPAGGVGVCECGRSRIGGGDRFREMSHRRKDPPLGPASGKTDMGPGRVGLGRGAADARRARGGAADRGGELDGCVRRTGVEAGDREAGGRRAGGRRAGDREAGDREAGDRKAGDREAGDREACDRKAGDRGKGRDPGDRSGCRTGDGGGCRTGDGGKGSGLDVGAGNAPTPVGGRKRLSRRPPCAGRSVAWTQTGSGASSATGS